MWSRVTCWLILMETSKFVTLVSVCRFVLFCLGWLFFFCVTEQYYVSIFFTRLWSMLCFSGTKAGDEPTEVLFYSLITSFLRAVEYCIKNIGNPKMTGFCVLEKHSSVYIPWTNGENRNVVLFCNTDMNISIIWNWIKSLQTTSQHFNSLFIVSPNDFQTYFKVTSPYLFVFSNNI